MNIVCLNLKNVCLCRVRILLLISILFVSVGTYGLGYTPTDGGLVVNLKAGDHILLSTWVDKNGNGVEEDGEEFFVCHYPQAQSPAGAYFNYSWDTKGNILKLFPQDPTATKPSPVTVWSIDTALTRIEGSDNFALGGISYTMWSSNDPSYTLLTSSGNNWKFQGDLTNNANNANACDVIFVAPTNRSTVTSFDPKKTLTTYCGRTDQDSEGRFNGKKGFGFLGLPYREVYMMVIPRTNKPNVYGNAALVGFNTTTSNYDYHNGPTAKPGQALFAFNDRKPTPVQYPNTRRTIFRLYILDDPLVSSCPDSYYFAYDEQDYKGYRMGPGTNNDNKGKTWEDSTAAKKIYTIDRLVCMERIPDTKYHVSDYMYVPIPDSTYYYVGYQNKYCHKSQGDDFDSQFKNIDTLKLQHMDKQAPRGAFGRMIVDTTQTSKQNLGVEFRPAGVFLRVDAGGGRYRNIEMHPEPGDNSWICNEMWTITDDYAALDIKATLYSQPEFSDEDEGIDIPGWSVYVKGTSVPLADDPSSYVTGDMTGWARVYTNKSTTNGGLEFVRADASKYVRYDNNGHFGATLPNTHAKAGETSVVLSEPRLLKGYDFLGWYTLADTTAGGFTKYKPGDVVTFSDSDGDGKDSLILYAQAKYTGGIGVAISFMKDDGKRYFLTHPNTSAPRYAKARHFDDWTDTYQGMSGSDNNDPRYLSTYLLIGKKDGCEECSYTEDEKEYVLDPRREMVHGAIDSVLFYEHFAPANEEYIGLYYVAGEFNKILANTTWAGLFQSTKGWPDPMTPCIENTKLYSTHYLAGYPSTITREERGNNAEGDTVYYNPLTGYFDGAKSPVTNFTISGVGVVDEHYVVLPDTTVEWTDTITFGIHQDEAIENPVWSKLIGKQLMLQMMVGDKITYFHPNDDKTITEYTQLRLSSNYRLDETFEYIRDARVESLGTVADEDKPHMNDRLEKNYFGRLVTSGLNTPVDVQYMGEYIDIVDTLRITLRPLGPNKIKEYYRRWKEGAPGLHIRPDGSRYRDIIVRTKTVHYGETEEKLVLSPVMPVYRFSPLKDAEKVLSFTLAKVRSRQLLDTEGNVLAEEILSSRDTTSLLHITTSQCTFTSGSPSSYFDIVNERTRDDHVALITKANNESGPNHDTLIINTSVTIDAVSYPLSCRVPLVQTTLESEELVWSAVVNGQRYFIMAGSGGLIFRQYELKGNTLYKKEDGKTQLVKGSLDAANSDTKYITLWRYEYVNQGMKQFTLEIDDPVNLKFIITGESTPGVLEKSDPATAATLTYEYVNVYVNENENFEEQVKLKYGSDKWLKLIVTAGVPSLTLTTNETEATVFSFTYLEHEYELLNNGAYPNKPQLEFGYNNTTGASVQTRYKARRVYSMLLNNTITYCGLEDEADIADLVNPSKDWRTDTTFTLIRDSRFSDGASGLSRTTNSTDLTTIVTPTGDSPTDIQFGGKYVNIVDTLDVRISLQDGAPDYRFADKWSSFKSVEDAHLKIPLIRKTYHSAPYDSLICTVADDEYTYVFPPVVSEETNTHTFVFGTDHRHGTNVLDVDNRVISYDGEADSHTDLMDFTDPSKTEIRLIEEDGSTPDWCEISGKTSNTITVRCKGDGIRSPRSANILLAYAMQVNTKWRYINFRVQVAQSSRFQFEGNQHLVHSKGASGDDLKDGVQQVHENRTILYYYNPHVNNPQSTDQRVELPIRERNFYGWWRWYSLQPGEEDSDIPAERWQTAPSNTGKWNFSFRTIGGKVLNPKKGETGEPDSILVTQGRYTVFHYPSQDYNARKDPPSKAPMVYPPTNKDTVTYAVDLSVYYDNLPLSMKNINQVDTTVMDTMREIIEPTLSIREIFELHPWTEMAEIMEGYKDTIESSYRNQRYLEDHVVRAPLNNRLLLKTEHRYNYDNIKKGQHSESLLGYYMRDDNWASMSSTPDPETGITRQDSMIWCGGWDADCAWYTYNPKTQTYDTCAYTITEANDFLNVPKKTSMPAGKDADTIIYCLRARSKSSPIDAPDPDEPEDGLYWFNICRYTIIYHRQERFGPKLEEKIDGVDKAIITNTEIEEHFDVMQRLNFDYNQPGRAYTVYPHPLPWADASYGFAYPKTAALPDNRPHNKGGLENLANMGEYNLINRIPDFGTYWHKMEQHGGAEKGYMIFCDGMSSAGQVAALRVDTTLCEGQKMYFSAFVGNPGNEKNKTCPNFTFSVQGSENGRVWEDITTYMTGDLPQSNKWYQIYFPIEQNKQYSHFRVRVYNMAANDDGNDFIIDDMCIFATKPPLLVYQANTTCKNENESDSLTHIVLRVDYQGFTDDAYKADDEFYTIQEISRDNDTTFLRLVDGYDNEDIKRTTPSSRKDTVYGKINLPNRTYTPGEDNDSIFANLKNLVSLFETTLEAHEAHEKDDSKPDVPVFRKGYVFEHLDDSIRPVFYVIHSAKMSSHSTYIVHMAGSYNELLSSQCGLTRKLKVRNRMILTLNGDEQPEKEVAAMCSNTLYDVSLHVKGTMLLDNLAPVEVTGSCYNDWLLHGDTTIATSETTYGYKYSDIEKVIKDILRADEQYGGGDNANHFARSLVEVDSVVMMRVQEANSVSLSDGALNPYTILSRLVNRGLLTLYQSNVTVLTPTNDSVKYTIFPITGSGSEVLQDMNIDVCPTPVHIALKSSLGGGVPLVIGGLNRSEEESQYPIVVLADVEHANSELDIPIDSLMMRAGGESPAVALKQIHLISTNDPEFREGVDNILLAPDRTWNKEGENPGYYTNGNDTLVVVPASESNYRMRGGYSYTFGIEMMTYMGDDGWDGIGECPVGTIPFTVSVVPDYLRWDPQTSDSRWNNPANWIGIDQHNTLIHDEARFAPLSTTHVLIPPMTEGRPYPVLPATITSGDSIQQVGFQYNRCKSIRFLPGGALSQQQRLEYDSVIADLSAPHDQWALRSAPIEGLLSGDIFMANADLTSVTSPWAVGPFDAAGRNYNTGNASFWLSLYSRDAIHQNHTATVDTIETEAATWSKVTNALSLELQPAQGWAVYTRTKSENAAAVRLPKNDDIYYFYTKYGDKVWDLYESGLQAKRATSAGGADKVGKMAFYPGKAATGRDYTLSNGVAATSFVFGNPTMGYIDIWGFISDNSGVLENEIGYMNASGNYLTITKDALEEADAISSLTRYLPPMHAIVLTKKGDADKSLEVTLNTNRIVTDASHVVRPLPAPASAPRKSQISKGIMTVTAVNPASKRCTSRLLLGQGFSEAIIRGEDATLTTINIDNYTATSAPATPFNIYAVEGNNGLSIDLRDEIVNVPISFYNSDLPFEPISYLWFTGVNNIDGDLVLYDALLDIERPILDGICLEIETPEVSHQTRYFIRRRGFNPNGQGNQDDPIATGVGDVNANNTNVMKLIKGGHVLIMRDGHVYTMFGQKVR